MSKHPERIFMLVYVTAWLLALGALVYFGRDLVLYLKLPAFLVLLFFVPDISSIKRLFRGEDGPQ